MLDYLVKLRTYDLKIFHKIVYYNYNFMYVFDNYSDKINTVIDIETMLRRKK